MSGNSGKVAYIRNSLLILICLLFFVLSPRSQSLSGPLLGFVRNSEDRSIRPIFGVPGAATVGPALELPLRFLQVEFSLKNDYAISVTEWESELVLLQNLSGNTNFESIFQADDKIERIALSPNAGYAAMISGSVIRLLSGLPSHPSVVREIRAPAQWPGMTALAVNDKGEIVAAFSDGMSGSVYWNGNGGELLPVAAAGNVSAMAFLPGQPGIVIADRLFDEVSLISGLPSNPSSFRLADASDDVSGPTAVEISDSGSQALVANEQSGEIIIIDLAGGTPAKLSCGCRPTTLRALRGRSVFALTEPSATPLMVLDGAHESARVVVVSEPTSLMKTDEEK